MIKTFMRRKYPLLIIAGILLAIAAAITTVTNTSRAVHLVEAQYNQTHQQS